MEEKEIISQDELDNLLELNEFIEEQKSHTLINEIKEAILDSGKLKLEQWETLRQHIKEIVTLI